MKISIIIPVYNVEKYINECLDSVLQQDFEDYEVICVNDGSTDESGKILELYAAKHFNIKIWYQSNEGQSSARNKGLKYAHGKYVCFLDSDDMLTQGALSRMYHAAEEYQTEILSYEVDCLKYENDKLRTKEYKDSYYLKRQEYEGVKSGKEFFVEMMENQEFCDSVCLLFINKKWLEDSKIQFYQGIFYEDVIFTLQCYLGCNRMTHVKQNNYIYRIREGSTMTGNISYTHVYSNLVIHKELFKLLLEESDYRVKAEIVRYARVNYASLKYAANRVPELERDNYSFFSPEERFLAECLDIGEEMPELNIHMYVNGFYTMLKKQTDIILYGAGKVGCMVYKYLQRVKMEHKIKCFAVSEKVEQGWKIEGVPVYQINELSVMSEVLVLVTVRKNYQWEIRQILKKLGFQNVAIVDALLESGLEKEIL